MLAYIKGQIERCDENLIVVEVGGIGYNLICTNSTVNFASNKIGQVVKFETYLAVREDAMLLYAFNSLEEKAMFKKLLAVSGIGPKVAIGILSGITPSDLALAILSSDVRLLTSVKGLGKKTAERIIVELKEKVDKSEMELPLLSNITQNNETDDAIFALVALGISKAEALKMVSNCYVSGDNAENIITKCLKNMGK